MLSMKKIDIIRKYKFDLDMPVRVISYKLDISPTTVYKYLKIKDFSEVLKPSRKKRTRKMEKYEPIIKEWLIEDKTRHYKQRHTAIRVFNRLREIYPDFDISYASVATVVRRLKSEVYYIKKEYAPLRHLPGEAQVDMGNCKFYEKGIEYDGCYVVVSFPYSNMAFCQLFKSKNIHCVVQGMKNIFDYIGGVPHEVTVDNDSALVKCVGTRVTKRIENELFLRFKNHYDFSVVYCKKNSPNHKGHVEGKVGYLRRNIFVPVPEFDDLDEYNKRLLDLCVMVHERKNHKLNKSIYEAFMDDIDALLTMPENEFEVASCIERKVDKEGRVRFQNQRIYFLKPELAGRKVQVKIDYKQTIFYDKECNVIAEFDRLYGNNYTAINWVDWLPTVMRRPNSLFHSALTDMFTERLKEFLLSGTSKLRSIYMKALCKIVEHMSLAKALLIADIAAEKNLQSVDEILLLVAN